MAGLFFLLFLLLLLLLLLLFFFLVACVSAIQKKRGMENLWPKHDADIIFRGEGGKRRGGGGKEKYSSSCFSDEQNPKSGRSELKVVEEKKTIARLDRREKDEEKGHFFPKKLIFFVQ